MVKRGIEMLIQLLLLMLIYQIGNYIGRFFHLQIPGNVIGIVLLFVLLCSGIMKVEQLELAGGLLLKHLGFFFIPISVGLMTLGHLLGLKGIYLFIILLISSVIGLISTGKATQAIIMKQEQEKNDHDYSL